MRRQEQEADRDQSLIDALISLHVGAGAAWLLFSAAAVLRRRAGRWLLTLQTGASLITLLAGILLWKALHSGGMGPVEKMLVIGTFCAFLALGLQIGIGLTGEAGRPSKAGFGLQVTSVVFLACAAVAMVASRFLS